MWKIYSAVKKTTKQEAAVFVFDKKILEKYLRRDRDMILEVLKKGVSQLTRLRHPRILSVMQPLEESRESLAFATEPVFASLANVLGNHENIPAQTALKELQEFQLYEVEIKYGLLQVTEGLQFLHHDVKMLHNNLCPESIIINQDGAWKIAGFEFCKPNKNPQDQMPCFEYKAWDPDMSPVAQPNLDYLAPEYALTESCDLPSDLFTLGVVMYTLFNKGKPLYECNDQLSTFRKNAEELSKWRGKLLEKLPEDLREIVKLLLNTEPAVRPDPDQLSKIPFFEDVGSSTLHYMDTLFQRDNKQKSQFFKGLPKIITKLPKRVNLQRILPSLYKECVNPDMVPFTLPSILLIAEQSTDREYNSIVLPGLVPLFQMKEPIQILLIFMQNMSLLLKKTPQADIKTHVLPMIFRSLEADTPQLQEMCLKIIPTFADLIDYTALKNSIVPRIKKLCLSTPVLGVRVNSLLCLGKLLEHMDKWFVLDEVIPLLFQIQSREPAVLMSILGMLKVTMSHAKLGITKEIMATKVLPFIIPVAIDHNLNLSQFNAYMSVIKEMIERVETDHRSKLEQLDQMKQEQKSLEITKVVGQQDDSVLIKDIVPDQPQTMMDQFLSGYGISNVLKRTGDGSGDRSDSRLTALSGIVPNGTTPQEQKTTKVPLTLEDKQRMAKQKEQEQLVKAQKPLQPKSTSSSVNPAAASNKSNSNTQVKDLTTSLMNSNIMGMQPSNTASRTTLTGMTPGFTSGSVSMSSTGSTIGQSSFIMSGGGLGSQSSFGSQSLMSAQNSQAIKPIDMSAFDTLLPNTSSQPKLPINQIRQQQHVMGVSIQGGMMGNPSMTGNQSMMGTQGITVNQGMMGLQSGGMNLGAFGGQGMNTGFSASGNTNMLNSFGSQPMRGQNNLLQPQPSHPMGSHNTTSALSSQDLADLLG
ncbi:hypothetical protein CHS0354_016306 [Potamilus streckersoni]|uniref:Protein kinase domain-containing protein n=1 Tax=Potamilus streckersoni TaxID=2493646 RepID=A0AAE0RMF8_9BIVA|nr:hypothetical protein CHS0354_016306 [Potamilus streckersoni]